MRLGPGDHPRAALRVVAAARRQRRPARRCRRARRRAIPSGRWRRSARSARWSPARRAAARAMLAISGSMSSVSIVKSGALGHEVADLLQEARGRPRGRCGWPLRRAVPVVDLLCSSSRRASSARFFGPRSCTSRDRPVQKVSADTPVPGSALRLDEVGHLGRHLHAVEFDPVRHASLHSRPYLPSSAPKASPKRPVSAINPRFRQWLGVGLCFCSPPARESLRVSPNDPEGVSHEPGIAAAAAAAAATVADAGTAAAVRRGAAGPVFHALGDPTRRAILARLARGPAAGGRPGRSPSTWPCPRSWRICKRLEEAGLIETRKQGRDRTCALRPGALDPGVGWLEEQRALWEGRLDRLERHLADAAGKNARMTSNTKDRPELHPHPPGAARRWSGRCWTEAELLKPLVLPQAALGHRGDHRRCGPAGGSTRRCEVEGKEYPNDGSSWRSMPQRAAGLHRHADRRLRPVAEPGPGLHGDR